MTEQIKKQRIRSPSYPSIDLKTAIERIKVIYRNANRSEALIQAILPKWGFKSNSMYGMKTIAALKSYGLIDDFGSGTSRRIKLSDNAYILIHSVEGSESYQSLLSEMALSPAIYKYMWDTYGSLLPDDDVIESHLVLEKRFNSTSVSGFLADYKSTLEYAKIDKSVNLSGDADIASENNESEIVEMESNSNIATQAPSSPLVIDNSDKEWVKGTLGNNKTFKVLINGGITAKDVGKLIKLLEVQKMILDDSEEEY